MTKSTVQSAIVFVVKTIEYMIGIHHK